MKEGLTELPRRMGSLPLDERGYPVPWFVAWVDGKPEFRASSREKFRDAVRKKLCWVCGEPLGVYLCFVAGCMCGINRTTSEPPCHLECGQWSAINCPFLSNPQMIRREDDEINNQSLRERSPGLAITRNPGVTMFWITREYELFSTGDMGTRGTLITMGKPTSVAWYREGRPATRVEVIESIETGLPNLEALARQELGGLEALNQAKERFWPYLPKE